MAGGFLGKLFGNRTPDPAAVAEARAELDRLIASRPAFADPLRWLSAMLPDLLPVTDPPRPDVSAARISEKLSAGVPFLRGVPLSIDAGALRRRWETACARRDDVCGDGAGNDMAEAVRRGKLDAAELLRALIDTGPVEVRKRAEVAGVDPGLAGSLLRFAAYPLLTAVAAGLSPLRGAVPWEQGYCPTCGSLPLLGEFRGLSQSRFLRCGLCADGWEVARLWCPYCGNRDHETLRFFHAEGEADRSRALVCDSCGGYVKMVSTLSALPPLALLVADAATLHLDLAVLNG